MAALGEATIDVRASLEKLERDLSGAKGLVSKAASGIESSMKVIGSVALGGVVAGITALGAGLGIAFSEAMAAQQVMAQTEAVIKSTGGAAGMSAKAIADLATSLSTQSRFSDDAIQAGENLLLTFKNIGADTFPMATQAMVDMATAMGTDVSGGAIQLGKALNDPVEGISALTRVGVTFTDEQKKVIKALVETGDVAGAQKIILEELNSEFGGSAAAAADTFAGKLDVLKNKLLNVAEGIGLQLLPVLTTLLDGVMATAMPIVDSLAASFGTFFDRMSAGLPLSAGLGALVAEIATIFGATSEQANTLAAKVSGIVDWFGQLIGTIGEVVAAIAPYLAIAGEWLAANFKLQDVLIALGIAIGVVIVSAIGPLIAAAAPIVLTFLGVVAVIALLRTAWERDWGGIQEKTAAVLGFLTAAIPAALASVQGWWAANGASIMATVQTTFATVQAVVASTMPIVQSTIAGALAGIQAFWQAHGDNIMTIVRFLWDVVVAVTTVAIGLVVAALAGLQMFWAAWGSTIVAIVSGMGDRLGFVIDGIASLIKGDWQGLGTAILGFWRSTWESIGLVLSNAGTILKGIATTLIAGIKGKFTETDWGGIGRSIIDGVTAGLRNAAGVLLDAARGAARAAFDAAMAAIRGGSPSRLFMDVGESMMQGMAIGIKRNSDLAQVSLSGALMPVMGLVGMEDGGGDRNTHYNPVTTINVMGPQDPMRVLRAARHLDRLGSIA